MTKLPIRDLQILLPMAGLGSRFLEAGFATPKPLIKVDGMSMFQKALDSIKNINAKKTVFFVVRQEHVEIYHLDRLIKEIIPDANVIIIPKMTRGAAETALAAKDKLNPDAGLIVMDCDLWFTSKSYDKMVEDSLSGTSDISGGLLTFEASNPRYSFAEIGKDSAVLRTAEKEAISSHAVAGAYFFATAQEFVDAAIKLLAQPLSEEAPEYYMSLLYNILIDEGKKIQAARADEYVSFGTPEELARYKKST